MFSNSVIAPKKVTATFVGRELIVEGVWLVRLTVKEPMFFKPGQYVSLKVTEQGVRRSYSVFSFEKGVVGLIIGIVPNGVGSNYIKSLQAGESVELMGFFGNFVMDTAILENTKRIFFVATGVGIAPFGSMIEKLVGQGFKGEILLLWGLRYVKGVYLRDYFDNLKKMGKNFDLKIYLSQPESEWSGKVGHVGDYLDNTENNLDGVWYLCGSNEMITEMKEKLIGKGVDEDDINYEKFY